MHNLNSLYFFVVNKLYTKLVTEQVFSRAAGGISITADAFHIYVERSIYRTNNKSHEEAFPEVQYGKRVYG